MRAASEVENARGVGRADEGRETDLRKVLEVHGYYRRDEHNVQQRHRQIHDEVKHVFRDLQPIEVAPGPETAAAIVVALCDNCPVLEHGPIDGRHDGDYRETLGPVGLVGEFREETKDWLATVEADPVARDEDQAVPQEAVR